jgi:hypothetical protein
MFNHPVISADGHIDLPWLPPTLFTEGAPAALKNKMPKVVEAPEGKTGLPIAALPLVWRAVWGPGRPYIPGQIYRSGPDGVRRSLEDTNAAFCGPLRQSVVCVIKIAMA